MKRNQIGMNWICYSIILNFMNSEKTTIIDHELWGRKNTRISNYKLPTGQWTLVIWLSVSRITVVFEKNKLSKSSDYIIGYQRRHYLARFIFGSGFCCARNVMVWFHKPFLSPFTRTPPIWEPPTSRKQHSLSKWERLQWHIKKINQLVNRSE